MDDLRLIGERMVAAARATLDSGVLTYRNDVLQFVSGGVLPDDESFVIVWRNGRWLFGERYCVEEWLSMFDGSSPEVIGDIIAWELPEPSGLGESVEHAWAAQYDLPDQKVAWFNWNGPCPAGGRSSDSD